MSEATNDNAMDRAVERLARRIIGDMEELKKVPTADELAAMRELVSNAPGFEETLDALTVVRAYLERVTG